MRKHVLPAAVSAVSERSDKVGCPEQRSWCSVGPPNLEYVFLLKHVPISYLSTTVGRLSVLPSRQRCSQ